MPGGISPKPSEFYELSRPKSRWNYAAEKKIISASLRREFYPPAAIPSSLDTYGLGGANTGE